MANSSIKMLAEKTGLSLSSVSRSLDPLRHHLVSEGVRQRVLAAAAQYNYVANYSARRLRSQKSRTVTVVTYSHMQSLNPGYGVEFHPPFITVEAIQELSRAIKARQFDMKIEYIHPDDDLEKMAREIVNPNLADGIIFIGYNGVDFNKQLVQMHLPHLFVSDYIDPGRQDIPFLGVSLTPGFRQGYRFLKEQKRAKIGYIGIKGSRILPIVEKILKEHDEYDPARFFQVMSYYELREVIRDWRQGDFDALFCSNDMMANWVVSEFTYCGVKVPEQVAVIGYDNDPIFTHLSSIGRDRPSFYERAVELLFAQMADPAVPAVHEVIDTEFFHKKTT